MLRNSKLSDYSVKRIIQYFRETPQYGTRSYALGFSAQAFRLTGNHEYRHRRSIYQHCIYRSIAAASSLNHMDGKGCYYDNILVEQLWHTVQYEHLHTQAFNNQTPDEVYYLKQSHQRITRA